MDVELEEAIARGYAERDRDDMGPTIAYFEALAAAHPGVPELVYEVAGAYDTAGQEERARPLYEQALADGLEGDVLRRCLLQYGSTLRNLGEFDASVAVLDRARREFPSSESVTAFAALSLHAAGRDPEAVGLLLKLVGDRMDGDLGRYRAALLGNAAALLHEPS